MLQITKARRREAFSTNAIHYWTSLGLLAPTFIVGCGAIKPIAERTVLLHITKSLPEIAFETIFNLISNGIVCSIRNKEYHHP